MILDGLVLLFGGRKREGDFAQTTQKLDPTDFVWKDVILANNEVPTPMMRSKGSCTVHNNRAWICGGNRPVPGQFGSGVPIDTCFSFGYFSFLVHTFETVLSISLQNGWRQEPDMPEVINDPAITGYEPDRALYIIGGKINYRDSNTVRVLKRGKWELGPYLPEKISGAHAIFLDHFIYVFGGTSNTQILRYSPTENPGTWQKFGKLNRKKEYLGIEMIFFNCVYKKIFFAFYVKSGTCTSVYFSIGCCWKTRLDYWRMLYRGR